MKPTRKLSRRSFLATVAGTVAAAGAIGVVAADPAEAFVQSDSDSGPNADPPGGGSGSGCTDADSGSYSDPPGNGRCVRRRARRSGCTDADSGRYGDPAGNGRCVRRRRRCTDSDTGRYSDPAGRGRRC